MIPANNSRVLSDALLRLPDDCPAHRPVPHWIMILYIFTRARNIGLSSFICEKESALGCGVPMHCSNVATATLEQCIGTPPARRRQFFPGMGSAHLCRKRDCNALLNKSPFAVCAKARQQSIWAGGVPMHYSNTAAAALE